VPGLRKYFLLLILVLIFVFPVSSIFTEVYPVANSKGSVCILYYETEFKKKLITALIESFNTKEISVTVDTTSNSDQYIPNNYDAVILLSGIEGFKPLPEAPESIL